MAAPSSLTWRSLLTPSNLAPVVGLVVLVCVVSDAILQAIGVAGVATVVAAHPWLETAGRWAGAIFLVGFAAVSARRAWRGGGSLEAAPEADEAGATSGGAVATRTRRGWDRVREAPFPVCQPPTRKRTKPVSLPPAFSTI